MEEGKYFAVTAKCGHVGRGQCIFITFPIIAYTAEEASKIAREIPRVKHHHGDCIFKTEEIEIEKYYILIEKNNNDPFLKCRNVQEQRNIANFEERIQIDESLIKKENNDREKRKKKVKYKQKQNKILLKSAEKHIIESIYG